MTSMPIILFGAKWDGSPIAEDVETVEAPVGDPCGKCTSPIIEGQSGLLIWTVTDGMGEYEPWHRLCFMLSILGPHEGHDL